MTYRAPVTWAAASSAACRISTQRPAVGCSAPREESARLSDEPVLASACEYLNRHSERLLHSAGSLCVSYYEMFHSLQSGQAQVVDLLHREEERRGVPRRQVRQGVEVHSHRARVVVGIEHAVVSFTRKTCSCVVPQAHRLPMTLSLKPFPTA